MTLNDINLLNPHQFIIYAFRVYRGDKEIRYSEVKKQTHQVDWGKGTKLRVKQIRRVIRWNS